MGKRRALQRAEKSRSGSPCVGAPRAPSAGAQAVPLPGRESGKMEVCARETGPRGWCRREEAVQLILRRLSLPGTSTTSLKSGVSPHRSFSPGANTASDPQGPETAPPKQQQCTFNKSAASLNKHEDCYL